MAKHPIRDRFDEFVAALNHFSPEDAQRMIEALERDMPEDARDQIVAAGEAAFTTAVTNADQYAINALLYAVVLCKAKLQRLH